MVNVCISKHIKYIKSTVKIHYKGLKIAYLYKVLTMNGAYGPGSCFEWVSE